MVTASRIWLLPTLAQTQSRSAWGDGLGGFSGSTEVSVGSGPYSVAIGDFNGDGKQDLAVANYDSSTVSIRLGDGLGGFSGSTEVSVGSSPTSVAIGDFNGDGKQDFAVANHLSGSGTVSIRLGQCIPASTPTPTPSSDGCGPKCQPLPRGCEWRLVTALASAA